MNNSLNISSPLNTFKTTSIFSFLFLTQATDDESPVVLGEPVGVERGQLVTITNTSLYISDTDTEPEHLQITIHQVPKHGINSNFYFINTFCF